MSRRSHAHPVRRWRTNVKFAVLSRFPLRWWWKLPPDTRDWWILEYQRRHPDMRKVIR